ncbi:hypothetical protein F8E02_07465 [Methanoculleus sp. Wushi-C6]|uniref:Uncharacterized protein n=1 Tax=Methanoculleus caldifontis TaxID=2651577 RepID=A0ABU3X2M9_9EURY|nr:hypothetical protein [Methanoculleus sp. Wushi-C6]MDV2481847.1 hypothetical protein [Methanoculleus sp. Wushi-C6]
MGKWSNALGLVLAGAGILVALLFICLVLLAGFLGQSSSESFSSMYHYELQISTTGPIEDAVLLIPIPSRYDPETGANVTPIDLSRASFSNFDRSGISVRIEDVDGIPMLNISADRIDPVYKNRIEPIAIMPGQNESELPVPTHIYSDRYSEETPVLVGMELSMLDTSPGHEIETRTPVGAEPLFMPYRIVGTLNDSGGPVDDYYVSPGSSGYIVEVPFILSFDAEDGNVLTISSYFQGANQWWVLGWQSNSYRERVHHEFTGPCNGTYLARGILVTGEGVY